MKNIAFFFACLAIGYMLTSHADKALVSILIGLFCGLIYKDEEKNDDAS